MLDETPYDVALVGGGLGGLALSIQLSRAGFNVALFEKEKYPFHKVCGEYLSFENWNFLEELGLPISDLIGDWDLPVIRKLIVSSPGGRKFETDLPLGGFGISRFKLDSALAEIAISAGVRLFEENKVSDLQYENNLFKIQTANFDCLARQACGSFGKKSNLDVKWKREFIMKKGKKLNHYVAIKYRVKVDYPAQCIGLHNFENGYCGISAIEDGEHCLCYMTTAENLTACGNSVSELEKRILCRNPFLKEIFSSATSVFEKPLAISQISFEKKSVFENHSLLVGDAAGVIPPLSGNGMSMALHGSKIAFRHIKSFLEGKTDRTEMENAYEKDWQMNFGRRMAAGRILQKFFGSPLLSDLLILSIKPFPKFVSYLIRQTHGAPY